MTLLARPPGSASRRPRDQRRVCHRGRGPTVATDRLRRPVRLATCVPPAHVPTGCPATWGAACQTPCVKVAGARGAKVEIVEGAVGAEAGREAPQARHPPLLPRFPRREGPLLPTAVPVPAAAALEPAGHLARGAACGLATAADVIEERAVTDAARARAAQASEPLSQRLAHLAPTDAQIRRPNLGQPPRRTAARTHVPSPARTLALRTAARDAPRDDRGDAPVDAPRDDQGAALKLAAPPGPTAGPKAGPTDARFGKVHRR